MPQTRGDLRFAPKVFSLIINWSALCRIYLHRIEKFKHAPENAWPQARSEVHPTLPPGCSEGGVHGQFQTPHKPAAAPPCTLLTSLWACTTGSKPKSL